LNNFKHKNIKIINGSMSYSQILELYYSHHISIQVSKHEGLGLGFYEAISSGTPIITLDTPPHNEIVLNNINGWIIPCYYKKMIDNGDPLFDSAYFYPQDLADKICFIASNMDIYVPLIKTMNDDLNTRLSYTNFENNFVTALSN